MEKAREKAKDKQTKRIFKQVEKMPTITLKTMLRALSHDTTNTVKKQITFWAVCETLQERNAGGY